jgi:hypothetical protein
MRIQDMIKPLSISLLLVSFTLAGGVKDRS